MCFFLFSSECEKSRRTWNCLVKVQQDKSFGSIFVKLSLNEKANTLFGKKSERHRRGERS